MKRFPIPADRRVEARGILIHRFSLAANNTLPTKGWLSFHSLKIGSLPKRSESIRKGQMPHRVMNMELQIVNRIAIHNFTPVQTIKDWCISPQPQAFFLLGVCFIRDFIEVRERCLLREDSIVNGWLYQSINDTVVCWNKDYAYQWIRLSQAWTEPTLLLSYRMTLTSCVECLWMGYR